MSNASARHEGTGQALGWFALTEPDPWTRSASAPEAVILTENRSSRAQRSRFNGREQTFRRGEAAVGQ